MLPTIKVTSRGLASSLKKDIATIEKNADRIHSGLADTAIADMAVATSRFRRPMSFLKKKLGAGSYLVYTEDKRFIWLNEGTKEHPITAKPGKLLIFNWAKSRQAGLFKAKSRPGSLKPAGDGSYKGGEAPTSAKSVKHPGSKKRDYSGMMRRRISRLMRQRYKAL